MLRIKRHSVIAFAPPNGISPYHLVRCGLNDRKDVLILEIDVHFAGYGIALWHPGFTVEMQRAYNLVLLHVDYGFGSPPLIGDVQLVERSGIGAAVRLGRSFEFLNDLHLFKVNHTDRVVVSVRCVELLEFGNVLPRRRAYRLRPQR